MRRPEEVMVVVYREGDAGREFLVLLRSPEQQGYWHVVAGGLEAGEAPARELLEETGLDRPLRLDDLGLHLSYSLAEEPAEVRARFALEVERVTLHGFAAAAPRGWEPELDWEHVEHRWLSAADAVALLRYAEPREALRAATRLGVGGE